MKDLFQHDYNHALGLIFTAAGAIAAKTAAYAPAPPTWADVGFGFLGGVLGAVIMLILMAGLRAERKPADLLYLTLITAAWAGLASAFAAAWILERMGLIAMGGHVATTLGGSVAAIFGIAVFPILIRLIGWVSVRVDLIAEALVRRIGGGK